MHQNYQQTLKEMEKTDLIDYNMWNVTSMTDSAANVMLHYRAFLRYRKTSNKCQVANKHWPLIDAGDWNLTTRCLAVTGDSSAAECCRLSQPSWLLGAL